MPQTYNDKHLLLSQKQTQQMRAYFKDQLEAYYNRIEHIDPSKMFGC